MAAASRNRFRPKALFPSVFTETKVEKNDSPLQEFSFKVGEKMNIGGENPVF